MLSIRLPDKIEKRLASLARSTGRTKTHYVREAIIESLSDMEAAGRAERRLREFEESGESAISSAEMRRQLGLD
jgi:RHH-type transcriptional regulator, rel operon repressor / antitoxin RelB